MSEREHDEVPEDLEPRDEAEEIRGGATPVETNIQKAKEEAAKTAVNNMR
jgi:hypothetical protein